MLSKIPTSPKTQKLSKCEPSFPEPKQIISKVGFSKELPKSFGGKPMPVPLKRPKTANKRKFKFYETEEPFFDKYLKCLENHGKNIINEYERNFGKIEQENIGKWGCDRKALELKWKQRKDFVRKTTYTKNREKGIITDLDVKNQKIYENNRKKTYNCEKIIKCESPKSVKSESTCEIIRYFEKNGRIC